MSALDERKANYFDILSICAVLGPGLVKKYQKENRQELKGKAIEAGERLCRQLEKSFNASPDQSEQVFLAREIKTIMEQIKTLKSANDLLFDNCAIVYIMASCQAYKHAYG